MAAALAGAIVLASAWLPVNKITFLIGSNWMTSTLDRLHLPSLRGCAVVVVVDSGWILMVAVCPAGVAEIISISMFDHMVPSFHRMLSAMALGASRAVRTMRTMVRFMVLWAPVLFWDVGCSASGFSSDFYVPVFDLARFFFVEESDLV